MELKRKKSLLVDFIQSLALGFSAVLAVNALSIALKWAYSLPLTKAVVHEKTTLLFLVIVSLIFCYWLSRRLLSCETTCDSQNDFEPFTCLFPLLILIVIAGIGLLILAKAVATYLPLILQYDFGLSVLLTTLVFLPTLRKRILCRQSWKKLGETWLKWSGVSAVAVGGFGFVGVNAAVQPLLQLALDRSQVGAKVLVGIYLFVVLLLGLAALFKTAGAASTEDESTYHPLTWFVPAFGCAWLGNVGLFSLFLDSVVLTLVAHFGV